MNSSANLAEQQRQFLEAMATHYNFTGDTRTVFLSRFDEVNANKENSVLAGFITWSRQAEDRTQKLQDELKKICQVLEKDDCPISKPKRGRQPKGKSPWEQAFKWLWQTQFPEWQQQQNLVAPNPSLSEQAQKNAVCRFLEEIENNFKYDKLLHIPEQPIILKDQYIPIQVTLERKYTHAVETTWGYAESEAELKRAYALKGLEESQPSQVDWKEAKKQHQRIIVLADPGMGKSTLLRREACLTAQEERQSLKNNTKKLEDVVFPLFLRLSDLAETPEEIIDAIPVLIQRDYSETATQVMELLREKLKLGKCLLLLDALDEVPTEHRKRLVEKLNRFAQRKPPCPIICTSRIVGYGGAFVAGVKEVEIVPFSQKQIEQYMETWFTQILHHPPNPPYQGGNKSRKLASPLSNRSFSEEGLRGVNNDSGTRFEFRNAAGYLNNDTVSAASLIQELRNKPQIRGLAQNPLLLSLICSLYQEKGLTLPARRCQVYEQAVRYMLGKWSKNRNPELNDAWIDAKTELLEELAYQFSCDGKEIFTLRQLRKTIDEYLRSGNASTDFDNLNASHLISELSEQDGILQKLHKDSDQYLFLHRTFQEYLTASYLNRSKDGIALATEHFWEYDWHETLSLLAGLMGNPVPLLQAITDEKDDIFSTLLLLAGRCMAECPENPHPLIAEIIDRIYKFWQSYPNAGFIQSIIVAIGQVNSQMWEKLQKALGDEGWQIRKQVAEVLGKSANPQAVEVLIQALHDEDKEVRKTVAEALGQIGSSEAVEPLIQILNTEDENCGNLLVTEKVMRALGQIGSPRAVEALIQIVNTNKKHEYGPRALAIDCLDQINSPQVVKVLIQALSDRDSLVRILAAQALSKTDNPQAINGLINALDDREWNVSMLAAEALVKTGNCQAVEALIRAFNDKSSFVKWLAVACALGQIGNPQAVEELIKTLNDKDSPRIWRGRVAEALARIGNPQAIRALGALLNDEDSQIRSEVAEYLGQIDNPQAVEVLIRSLNGKNNTEVVKGLRRLGLVGNFRVLAAFIKSQPPVEILIQDLTDEDSPHRTRCLWALYQIGTLEVLAKLIQLPEINIRRPDIFLLARTLAIRFSKEKLPFIPVYPELVAHKR